MLVQARLVSLLASYELECGAEGVQERLQELVHVLPDLGATTLTQCTGCNATQDKTNWLNSLILQSHALAA